jgi:hypothetical protein
MLLFVAGWSVFQSRADDADTIAAINASSNAPYEAFTKKGRRHDQGTDDGGPSNRHALL